MAEQKDRVRRPSEEWKQELPPELFGRARLFCDLPEQSRRIGEFQHAGEGALTGGQADMQRDILTDTLTDHLVESGALKLSDLLLRQWSHRQDDAAL